MKVSQIGQFGLIEKITELIRLGSHPQAESWQNLHAGAGDDCAVWQGERTCYLSKVDSQVQGIHFSLDIITWQELGWKALAVNLSDIAAMGGLPLYALVSLGLPFDTEVEDIMSFYRGMLDLAGKTGTAIIGGHVSAAPQIFIDVQVTGRTASPDGRVMLRSEAVPGDLVAVTGWLGSAAGGLRMLKNKSVSEGSVPVYLKAAFVHPEPRLEEGRCLLDNGVKCAIDISDGLVSDLGHICRASGTGAEIRLKQIPIREELIKAFGESALNLALSGGEDYQLLFTAAPSVMKAVQNVCLFPVTVIGNIISGPAGQIALIDQSGNRTSPVEAGWDHFKK
jgi:thiamine-monophosphate kinase